MEPNLHSALRSLSRHKLLPVNLLAGFLFIILMSFFSPDISDLQAGQTYYYDTKGNLVTEEEYRKIIERINGQVEKPSLKQAETDDSSEDENTPESGGTI